VELVVAHGLRRCSVEDIAERSGLGRTTVYRRFEGRDQILYALLAREARVFFAAIADAVGHLGTLEDRLTEGFLAGVRAATQSSIGQLLRTEPDLLPLVTTEAGPVIALAREALLGEYTRMTGRRADLYTTTVAEACVRLALSYALTPDQAGQIDRATCRRLLGALIAG
jgi:AcrR family transcriptional regulator